ncbi:hypothetical protein FRACA_4960002 [Frankia canadensis]|uniref:Uncharacterized protein n=1 Tax=Frankia canadensis TaxID=1836972 RepID=A0A2I2KY76_9ACTN|nr:hypothetical protein FRACA_4960002 [Frankia canadensis]SOU57900.1 hypothetical protein FRACA_4960002 [Frankia canadensis]
MWAGRLEFSCAGEIINILDLVTNDGEAPLHRPRLPAGHPATGA